jgi:hypothetical protein
MLSSDFDNSFSVGSSGEEAERATTTTTTRPLNATEEKAAKCAKVPVTNPFGAIRERMSSHRAASTAAGAPAPEATANEAAVEDPAQAMLTLANTERARAPKMKEPSKSGAHTSGKRLSVEPRVSVETRLREYLGQGFLKGVGNLR